MATISGEDESSETSSKTSQSSLSPTQVDTVSATGDDDDNDDTNPVPEILTTGGRRSGSRYPERNKDFPSATISAANLKNWTWSMATTHVHKNSGSHLHRGIGAGEDSMWQAQNKCLLPFQNWLYDVLKGKADKEFVNKVSNILESVLKRDCNSEQLMVFIPFILQKAKGVTGLADIRKRILLRITQWRDGKTKSLVEDIL